MSFVIAHLPVDLSPQSYREDIVVTSAAAACHRG